MKPNMNSELPSVELLQKMLGNSSDLLVRKFSLVGLEKMTAILFIEGIVDTNSVQRHILEPLMEHPIPSYPSNEELLSFLASSIIQVKAMKQIKGLQQAVDELLDGHTIIMVDGLETFLSADTAQWNKRTLSSPKGQRVIKGPEVGFTEDRTINVSLVRKIIKSPELHVVTKKYGTNTNTDVSVMYLGNKVNKQVLQEIMKKLEKIDLDSVLEANYLEEVLTKDSKSIFPLMLNTDRPDVVAAEILEGKVAIFVDGSPYNLIAPAVFIQFFQTPEDYYFIEKSIKDIRLFRFLLAIISVYTPGIYVAFITYHTNLLPINLLLGFVAQRELVPIPSVVEVFVLLLLVGAIFESSTRLPQNVSITVSVFAAIIFGQSAVEAQLVQPVSLVVVSASYIMGSLVPIVTLEATTRFLKFIMIIVGATLGLYGITLLTIIVLLHLCSLRSFGIPYFIPFAPFVSNDQHDGLFRGPLEKIVNDESIFTEEESMKETEE